MGVRRCRLRSAQVTRFSYVLVKVALSLRTFVYTLSLSVAVTSSLIPISFALFLFTDVTPVLDVCQTGIQLLQGFTGHADQHVQAESPDVRHQQAAGHERVAPGFDGPVPTRCARYK